MHRKTPVQSLFFNKVAGPQLYLKRDLAQVFSCEFCEISKNTLFYRTPPDNYFCASELNNKPWKFYIHIFLVF